MFAAKARPLTRFLREDAPAPTEDEVSRQAFEQLKSALQVAPILRTPDWNKPFLDIVMHLEKRWAAPYHNWTKMGMTIPFILLADN
jgi:hypothetical protein